MEGRDAWIDHPVGSQTWGDAFLLWRVAWALLGRGQSKVKKQPTPGLSPQPLLHAPLHVELCLKGPLASGNSQVLERPSLGGSATLPARRSPAPEALRDRLAQQTRVVAGHQGLPLARLVHGKAIRWGGKGGGEARTSGRAR